MEKREYIKISFLIILLIISFLFQLSLTKAIDSEDIQKTIGINPENIPSDPDALKEQIKSRYLQQEWGKIISKNKVLGPIHNFFISNPLLFQILFKEPYALSLVFFCTFILWLYLTIGISDIMKKSGLIKSGISLIVGIASTIITAQLGIIKWIVNSALYIIFAREAWWIRLIIWIAIIVLLVIIYYVKNLLAQQLKLMKKSEEKSELKQKTQESEAFIKGVKEGQQIAKKYYIS